MNYIKLKITEIRSNKNTKNFLANTGWLVAQSVYQMILSIIIGALSARYLGPTNFGTISYGMSIILLSSSISSLGLESIIVNKLAINPAEAKTIIGTAIGLRVLSSLISQILIIVMVMILEPNNSTLVVITLLQSISLLFNGYEIIGYWYQSVLKSKYSVIAISLASSIVSVWKIFLLVYKADVRWFALSVTIQAFTTLVILVFIFIKETHMKLNFCIKMAKRLLEESYHYIISGLGVVIYMQTDKILLGKMLNESAVGYYTVATTISFMWAFIPFAIINSARPLIMKLKIQNEMAYQQKLKQLYTTVIYIGIFVSLCMAVFSRYVIFILYGNQYMQASDSLIISVWTVIFAILGSARNIWLVSEGKNRYAKTFTIWGAIVNFILNIILISIWNIVGASIATLVAQIFVCFIVPMFYKETRASSKLMLDAFLLKGITKKYG